METTDKPPINYTFDIKDSLNPNEAMDLAVEQGAHSLVLFPISASRHGTDRLNVWYRRHYMGIAAVNGKPEPIAAVIIQGTRLLHRSRDSDLKLDIARRSQELAANLAAAYLRIGDFALELGELASENGIKVCRPRGNMKDLSLGHEYCTKRHLYVPEHQLEQALADIV